jgi:hypothetical protein
MNKWNQFENYEEPTITQNSKGSLDETRITHPAFAQIRASRVQGGAYLYGSDFMHHNYIEITLCHSVLDRSLSRDWPHAGDEIVSIKMSEAQWAHFVSSLNAGMGTQCTLNHIGCNPIPGIPAVKPPQDTFMAEMKEAQKGIKEQINVISNKIKAMGLPKKKEQELLLELRVLGDRDAGSHEFVAKSFGQHMETVTEKAKVEINAYATMVLHNVGIEALQNAPLQISYKEEKQDEVNTSTD